MENLPNSTADEEPEHPDSEAQAEDPDPDAAGGDDSRFGRLGTLIQEQQRLIDTLNATQHLITQLAVETDELSAGKAISVDEDELQLDDTFCGAWLMHSRAPAEGSAAGGVQLAIVARLSHAGSVNAAASGTKWYNRRPVRAVALALTPLLIFFVQFALLVLATEAGSSHACDARTQDGCRLGEYCSLAFARGQCNDCSLLLGDFFGPALGSFCPNVSYDFDANFVHPLSGVAYVGSCAMYGRCTVGDEADTDINRCDYVVRARTGLKFHHYSITVVGALLLAISMVNDMAECDTELAAYLHAQLSDGRREGQSAAAVQLGGAGLRASTRGHLLRNDVYDLVFRRKRPNSTSFGRLLYLLFFACQFLRKQMLPSLIASAAVVILVADEGSESFGAVAVFLNILAVGFIGEFDNMLGKMLVHTDQVISHEQLVNQLAKAPSRALRRPVRWLQNRVHALSLCVAISMEALYMEELILHLNPIFGGSLLGVGDTSRPKRAFERIGADYADDANCNKVIFAVQAMTLFRALFGSCLLFTFDVWETTVLLRHTTRFRRRLLDHALVLLLGGLFVFGVFRLVVEIMEDLRVRGAVFV